MHKVRKILVPVDFSPECGQALRDAYSLARETGAQLIALHVIDERAERDILLSHIAPVEGLPFFLNGSAFVALDVMRRERTLDLWNFIERQAEPMSQDRIMKVVRIGNLSREINNFLRDEAVDLLVLKLRRKRLFPDLTTLRLLKMAGRLSCPVLLDPPAARDHIEPKDGLFDFNLLAQARFLTSHPAV